MPGLPRPPSRTQVTRLATTEETVAAVRAGLREGWDGELVASSPAFRRLLARDVANAFGKESGAWLGTMQRTHRTALQLARRGHPRRAAVVMAACRTTPSLPTGVCHVEAALRGAVAAYIAYRRGDARLASTLLDDAMAMDRAVASTIPLMGLHRVQLVHNRLRLESVAGRHIDIVRRGQQVIEHLEGHRGWAEDLDPPALAGIPHDLVEDAAIQVAGEVAVSAHAAGTAGASLLETWADMHAPCPGLPRLRQWMLHVLQDPPDQGVEILREGPAAYGVLWCTTLLDYADAHVRRSLGHDPRVLDILADIRPPPALSTTWTRLFRTRRRTAAGRSVGAVA